MALGGGLWFTQNKKLPGSYINFISIASASSAPKVGSAMSFLQTDSIIHHPKLLLVFRRRLYTTGPSKTAVFLTLWA